MQRLFTRVLSDEVASPSSLHDHFTRQAELCEGLGSRVPSAWWKRACLPKPRSLRRWLASWDGGDRFPRAIGQQISLHPNSTSRQHCLQPPSSFQRRPQPDTCSISQIASRDSRESRQALHVSASPLFVESTPVRDKSLSFHLSARERFERHL